jgi:thymidylate synthase
MKKDIKVINPNSNIAVCTLWSKKEEIERVLGERAKKVNVIGTLYTSFGLNYVIQTLCKHTNIDTLIVFGDDKSSSGDAIVGFFSGKKVKELVISREAAESVRKTVRLIDLRNCKKEELLKAVDKYYKERAEPVRKEMNVEIRVEEASGFPKPLAGFLICESSVFRAWVKLLYYAKYFGFRKKTEYGEEEIELLNTCTVINLYGRKYEVEERFLKYFSREDFERHVASLLSPEKGEGVEYTYGERLFSHRLFGNQVERVIEYLKRAPYTRRAVAVTLDLERDRKTSFPPCISLVQCTVSGNFLFLTAYMRSNDVARAFPINMYGQIKLAEYIAERVDETLNIGAVAIVSFSSHVYSHDFNFMNSVVKAEERALYEFVPDEKGNVIIERGKVTVLDSSGMPLFSFEGNKERLYYILKSLPFSSDHAVFLGREIERVYKEN